MDKVCSPLKCWMEWLDTRVFLKGHFVKKKFVHPTTQLVGTQEDHIQKERLNEQV